MLEEKGSILAVILILVFKNAGVLQVVLAFMALILSFFVSSATCCQKSLHIKKTGVTHADLTVRKVKWCLKEKILVTCYLCCFDKQKQ